MGDENLLRRFYCVEQVVGARGFGAVATKLADDLLQPADVLLTFVDIGAHDI